MEAQRPPAPRVTQVGQEASLSNKRGRSITAESPRTYAVSRDHALRQLATSERASERNSQTASHTPTFQQQFDDVTLHPVSGPTVTTGWHIAAHGYDTVGAPCNQETFRESYNAAQYANAMPATGRKLHLRTVSERYADTLLSESLVAQRTHFDAGYPTAGGFPRSVRAPVLKGLQVTNE